MAKPKEVKVAVPRKRTSNITRIEYLADAMRNLGATVTITVQDEDEKIEVDLPTYKGVPFGYVSRSAFHKYIEESIYTLTGKLCDGCYVIDNWQGYNLTEKGKKIAIMRGNGIYLDFFKTCKELRLTPKK